GVVVGRPAVTIRVCDGNNVRRRPLSPRRTHRVFELAVLKPTPAKPEELIGIWVASACERCAARQLYSASTFRAPVPQRHLVCVTGKKDVTAVCQVQVRAFAMPAPIAGLLLMQPTL